jgi:hypothetical protein
MVAMSRFLDEKGRFFGKVNIVDLLVLLVIVAVVVFAVVRMTGDSSKTVPVRVTYVVEEVRQATVDALRAAKGDVTDEGGTYLGTVKEVVVNPTREEYMTTEDQLEAFDSPVFSDVKIVVLGEGWISGSTVHIGSVPMRVGKKVTLVGTGYEVQTVIMGVVWGDEAAK